MRSLHWNTNASGVLISEELVKASKGCGCGISCTPEMYDTFSWCLLSHEMQTYVLHSCGLQVYKGVWNGNTPVAVKFVTGHSPKEQQRFRNEVAILKSLRHVNIVQFLGASLTGDQIMLVTEYMPRGDLWRALSQDSTHHFSWSNV